MKKEEVKEEILKNCCEQKIDCIKSCKGKGGAGGPCGFIGFVAFLGALVYFWQHSHTFWEGVVGFFKAVIWPALVVYKVLEFFKF